MKRKKKIEDMLTADYYSRYSGLLALSDFSIMIVDPEGKILYEFINVRLYQINANRTTHNLLRVVVIIYSHNVPLVITKYTNVKRANPSQTTIIQFIQSKSWECVIHCSLFSHKESRILFIPLSYCQFAFGNHN